MSLCKGTVIHVLSILFIQAYSADYMLPNKRTTLDDCRLRFNDLGGYVNVAPTFGGPTRLKEFAHMGAIGWTQEDGSIDWKCGGALIWTNFVLTAAHCAVDSNDVRPDVIRFGDLDLSSDDDDEYAQQLKIVEIFRHSEHRFSAKYHDIALLKLESEIKLHETVVPACIWTDPEIRFRTLEATGWGRTGFGKDHTPVLLKVTLKPIENSECSAYYTNETIRGLRQGLSDQHLCAVDEKMDTCEGDSGGPLQVKLFHNNRMTPFIVGVTSFGVTCGTGTPGVYTKVGNYLGWIVDTMRKAGALVEESNYNPTLCALKFASYREYDDAMLQFRNNTYVEGSTDDRRMFVSNKLPSYMVQLGWQSGGLKNCYGIAVDEMTILTVAHCAFSDGLPVSYVSKLGEIDKTKVSNIHLHPGYTSGLNYNNIAILRLEQILNPWSRLRPACISHRKDLPSTNRLVIFGTGRRDINELRSFGPHELNPQLAYLVSRVNVQNETSCLTSNSFASQLSKGLASEHICAGNDIFMVPESCNLMIGGAMQDFTVNIHTFAEYSYPEVFGLSQLGRDCGYGEHLIATRLLGHLDWLSLMLLPNNSDELTDDMTTKNPSQLKLTTSNDNLEQLNENIGHVVTRNSDENAEDLYTEEEKTTTDNSVQFQSTTPEQIFEESNQTDNDVLSENVNQVETTTSNDDLGESSTVTPEMTTEDPDQVMSTTSEEVDSKKQKLKPKETMEKKENHNQFREELLNCPSTILRNAYKELLGPTALVSSISDNFRCLGVIISKSIILTTASCLRGETKMFVQLPYSITIRREVKSVFQHPEFNSTEHSNDIALVKLAETLIWSPQVYPACLWTNTTHTPLVLKMVLTIDGRSNAPIGKGSIGYFDMVAMYNSDCQRTHPYKVLDTQVCAKDSRRYPACNGAGGFLKFDRNDGVPFVVGLTVEAQKDCINWYYMLFTRVSSFVDWIEDNEASETQNDKQDQLSGKAQIYPKQLLSLFQTFLQALGQYAAQQQ